MTDTLSSIAIRHEHDIVAARQRSRLIAELVGFDRIDQTRIATAVSEIARNAFQYASGGRVDFRLEGHTAPQLLVVQVIDQGPGIRYLSDVLDGTYHSTTGMGVGLAGARRLMDRFDVASSPRGSAITMAKLLPARGGLFETDNLSRTIRERAAEHRDNPIEEVQRQNQELVRTLDALRARQEEVERINRELEDTNRGVVALYGELDERADHLRRADEVKTRFLSNMTHEFRTPVNSILALTRLLAEQLGTDDSQPNEVSYIRRSAEQLSDLIDDLLDIAKVEAGKIDVRPTLFEVAGLFGALRGMLRPLLPGNSLALVFEDPVDLPPMHSDETKISQILRNFISNALKYTEHGEVRVQATLLRDENAVMFTVTDTGIGIPEQDLPRIFDEFVQIENPLQRRVKGTGLGLPLSQRLAKLLHGRIDVTSTLGQGSVFTLTVPLAHRDPVKSVVAPPRPGATAVLLVEDSDEDALIYQRDLARTRFDVVHATSVASARQLLKSAKPAAVVLDVHLQGREAWDLLIELKRDTATAALPVIVVSAADHRRKALGLGATAFALKPVDPVWLLTTLEESQREGRVRVLTIDDDETFRYVIRANLATPEFQVSEAATATEGLAKIAEIRPDVVLLDFEFPDMNGDAVVERLATNPATAHVPIIVITSHYDAVREGHGLERAIRVISKATLSSDVLRSAIRDAVQVSSAR